MMISYLVIGLPGQAVVQYGIISGRRFGHGDCDSPGELVIEYKQPDRKVGMKRGNIVEDISNGLSAMIRAHTIEKSKLLNYWFWFWGRHTRYRCDADLGGPRDGKSSFDEMQPSNNPFACCIESFLINFDNLT